MANGEMPPRAAVKVMADYHCHPLWWDSEHPAWEGGDRRLGDIDPLEIGLSEASARDLQSWADRFDQILNQDDPANSRFGSAEAEAAFHREGRALAVRAAHELGPEFSVRYWLDEL